MKSQLAFQTLWLALLLAFPLLGHAQSPTMTLSGYVEEATSGERLIGATLFVPALKTGVTTNRFGYFSLRVSGAAPTVIISHVGYESVSLLIQHDTTLTVQLRRTEQTLQEVTIRNTGKDTPQDVAMSRFVLPLDLVKKAPALLGETDILKTIQLLPGVQAGAEGTVGLNVRGGSPDQNLVLLDGIPLYNLNHLFGFFSVINTDAVARAEFLKGSIPARYGGRLSSVLDITMRDGHQSRWQGSVGISPIAGRFTLEGPIKKDKGSILITGRRTWIDALGWAATKVVGGKSLSGYGFYDLNGKANYRLSARDRLYASFYAGQDNFKNQLDINGADYRSGYNWGNRTLGLRWNHVFNNRLFGNLTAYQTTFNYGIYEEYKSQNYIVSRVSSGIRDAALKADFDYYPGGKHAVSFGGSLVAHQFRPEVKQFKASTTDTLLAPGSAIHTGELTAYVEDDWKLSDRWRLQGGLHYAAQSVQGRIWHSLQPRLSVRYQLDEVSSLKASYNRMAQYLHLLTNSSVGLPTDLWVPVTDRIRPETADWLSAGYSRTLGPRWSLSVESYYKRLYNVLEYREGNSYMNSFGTAWFDRVAVGRGTSYGAEFFLEKVAGRTKGWASYTLSKTDRQFSELNNGNPFPYKFDRRHNLALVMTHDLSKNKSLSANFVLSTGTALTLARSRYEGLSTGAGVIQQNNTGQSAWNNEQYYYNLPDVSQRNNYRTPTYHRLDISYKTSKVKAHGVRTWTIGCYNVYNRSNPFYLFYDKDQLKQFSLFPAIPSVTYQFDWK